MPGLRPGLTPWCQEGPRAGPASLAKVDGGKRLTRGGGGQLFSRLELTIKGRHLHAAQDSANCRAKREMIFRKNGLQEGRESTCRG